MKRLITLIAAITLALPFTAHAAITDNISSYWKFDESSGSSADAVGGQTLTLQSGASYNTGKINNGLVGTSGGAGSTRTSSVTIPTALGQTISAWFKTSSSATMTMFADPKLGSPFQGLYLEMGADFGGSAGKVVFDYRNSSGTDYTLISPSTYNDGTFHHAVGTISAGGAMILYIDGVSVASGVTATGNNSGSNSILIGQDNGNFNGTLDEMGLWSRALTGTEAATLYSGGAGCQYSFGSCIAPAGPNFGTLIFFN